MYRQRSMTPSDSPDQVVLGVIEQILIDSTANLARTYRKFRNVIQYLPGMKTGLPNHPQLQIAQSSCPTINISRSKTASQHMFQICGNEVADIGCREAFSKETMFTKSMDLLRASNYITRSLLHTCLIGVIHNQSLTALLGSLLSSADQSSPWRVGTFDLGFQSSLVMSVESSTPRDMFSDDDLAIESTASSCNFTEIVQFRDIPPGVSPVLSVHWTGNISPTLCSKPRADQLRDMIDSWGKAHDLLRDRSTSFNVNTFTSSKDMVRGNILQMEWLMRRESFPTSRLRNMTIANAKHLGSDFQNGGRVDGPTFRPNLLQRYQNSHDVKRVKCAVSHLWFKAKECTAAHIIPCSFGSVLFKQYFGPDPETAVMDPTNGFLIHKEIEEKFDHGQLVVLPLLTRDNVHTFRAVVLDEELLPQVMFDRDNQEHLWAEIDGKELSFSGPNRPSSAFFYFHMLMTVFKKLVTKPPGWSYRLADLICQEFNEEKIHVPCNSYVADGLLKDLCALISNPNVLHIIESDSELIYAQTEVTGSLSGTQTQVTYTDADFGGLLSIDY